MDMQLEKNAKEDILGKLSIFITYTLWGVQSLYWEKLSHVSLLHILAQRIIWSFVFLIITLIISGHVNHLFEVLKDKKKIKFLILSASLILFNWSLNIYAVYSNQLIQASLGHYITPIFTVVMGIVVFKEHIEMHHKISLLFAGVGIMIMMLHIGSFPALSILLTLSFGSYSIVKKIIHIDSMVSVTVEMGLLLPPVIIYLFLCPDELIHVLQSHSLSTKMLLFGTGLFTSIPLVLFSYGVKKVPFSITGYIQYFAPTLSLLIAIFIFHENFSKIHLLSFGFVWIAILVFLIAIFKKNIIESK